MENKPSYFSILTADVRYDRTLIPRAILLYSEITSLCNKEGYCWAGNDYFAGLYEVHKDTVQEWISELEKRGHIETEIVNGGRRIRLSKKAKTPITIGENAYTLSEKIPQDGSTKPQNDGNATLNNKYNNKSNNTHTVSEKKYIPLDSDGVPMKVQQRKVSRGKKSALTFDDGFEEFWSEYPRQVARPVALKAWRKARITPTLFKEIMSALVKHKESTQWQSEGGRYVPNPAKWLEEQRWSDTIKEDTSSGVLIIEE